MGLESGSFIATLVSTNPVGATDPKSQGDDHIRLIKKALQNSFPRISTTVEATPAELNFVVGATEGLVTLSAMISTVKQSLSVITSTIGTAAFYNTGISLSTIPVLGVKSATTMLAGLVEQSTSAENAAGTDNTVFPSVKGIREAFNATGTAPVYACRAWVNFNGTGTVAINASGNVSSITDNGTGDYTVNFTTALPDANYALAGTAKYNGTDALSMRVISISGAAALSSVMQTTSVRISVAYANGSLQDPEACTVVIFR